MKPLSYMEAGKFVEFCKERGVTTSLSELEYYEEKGILYPAFRIKKKRYKLPEEAWCRCCGATFKPANIGWRANPWDETCPHCLPPENEACSKCDGHKISYIVGKWKEILWSELKGKLSSEEWNFEKRRNCGSKTGYYEPVDIVPHPDTRVQIGDKLDYEAICEGMIWKTTSEALQYYEKECQLTHPSKVGYIPWEDYYDYFITEKGDKRKQEPFKTYYGYYQIYQSKWVKCLPRKFIDKVDDKLTIRKDLKEIESIFKPLIELKERLYYAYVQTYKEFNIAEKTENGKFGENRILEGLTKRRLKRKSPEWKAQLEECPEATLEEMRKFAREMEDEYKKVFDETEKKAKKDAPKIVEDNLIPFWGAFDEKRQRISKDIVEKFTLKIEMVKKWEKILYLRFLRHYRNVERRGNSLFVEELRDDFFIFHDEVARFLGEERSLKEIFNDDFGYVWCNQCGEPIFDPYPDQKMHQKCRKEKYLPSYLKGYWHSTRQIKLPK